MSEQELLELSIQEKKSICIELLEKVKAYEKLMCEIGSDVVYNLKGAVQSYKKMQEFGIAFQPQYNTNYYKVSEHEHIAVYGGEYTRTISWSDNDEQPEENEWLYRISFPTGPYVLIGYHCEEYLEKLFNRMWAELKEFEPRYCDTHNNNMYFTAANAALVHDKFAAILKKYREVALTEVKRLKIENMEKELDKLKLENKS